MVLPPILNWGCSSSLRRAIWEVENMCRPPNICEKLCHQNALIFLQNKWIWNKYFYCCCKKLCITKPSWQHQSCLLLVFNLITIPDGLWCKKCRFDSTVIHGTNVDNWQYLIHDIEYMLCTLWITSILSVAAVVVVNQSISASLPKFLFAPHSSFLYVAT